MGLHDGGNIAACYATGNVQGTDDIRRVGGLVGAIQGATTRITASYATGSVNGVGSNVGGLVRNHVSIITASYSFSMVTGTTIIDSVGSPPTSVSNANQLTLSNAAVVGAMPLGIPPGLGILGIAIWRHDCFTTTTMVRVALTAVPGCRAFCDELWESYTGAAIEIFTATT